MDKELELAVTNPKEYLSKPQSRREWDMSIDDAERVTSYNPAEVLLTKAQRDPKGYNWVQTVINSIGRGAESFFSPATGAQALTELYTSPHMPKEQAERLIEDMAYTRYAGRMAKEAARPIGAKLGEEKYPVTATFSQGVGQFIAQTLTGIANPYAAWSTLYATSQGQMEENLVDSYIEKTGGIEGYADRKYADDMLVAGFASLNTLIERGLGAERIIERAFHNPTNTGLKEIMGQILNPDRIVGKQLFKQSLRQAGKQALKTGTGELAEESVQEYVSAGTETLAGYKSLDDLLSDKQLQEALIAGAYAFPIGAAAGFGMHYANRAMVKKRVNAWAKKHGLNLTDNQLTVAANELMDETRAQAMEQVLTLAEIQNKYGPAFNIVKERVKEIVKGTGTVPWTIPQAEDTETTTNPFKEAWPNHEATPRGTVTKLNDKYQTTVAIVRAINGKNKGKYSVHVSDTNARTDTLTTDGKWGNLSQVDENGVAIPWSAQYFDTAEEAWNATAKMFETKQPSKTQAQLSEEKLDQYATLIANTITGPMVLQANKANLPLSDFLDVVKMHVIKGIKGPTPVLQLDPIENLDQLKEMLAEQEAIIKEQNDAAKLGIGDPAEKEKAQRRKAILQYAIREQERIQGRENARRTRKRENADYITAKDLQPEQTATIDTATQAQEGQDYVLIAGRRIPVEYQVVELDEVQPSHIDGTPNPNYTNVELQNRASRGTTQDVADLREKATNITPERLLKATTAAEGAPVVNAQGEVIAGNGRAEIVRYAYENPETAEKYRSALEKAGFKTEGMSRPILVRRNTTMTPEEQVAAADISNISETSAFDEASQARRDSKYLKDSPTATDFAAKLPMSERRGLMQNNGKWNARRVKQRYESALLSWLCGNDTQLFERLVLDGKISQKVLDVLTANGSLIYETDTKYPELGLREDIYRALAKMQVASKDNFIEITQQIEAGGRDVMPENIMIWNWLYADSATNRMFLNNYATKLSNNQEQVANGQDLFGQPVAPLSKKDALMQALKTTDEERAQMSASKGREYEPLFDPETGEVKNPELAAAIASYQNQFAPVANPENTQLNKVLREQLDLANQNAKLDEIHPEYTGETIVVDGKERTVYNSKNERIAKSAEALTNFWNWFGDSKAVDKDGRPLVLYHGTSEQFDTFDKTKIGSALKKDTIGFFFITDKNVAKTYDKRYIRKPRYRLTEEEKANNDSIEPMSLYLKISNPITVNDVYQEPGFDSTYYTSPIDKFDANRNIYNDYAKKHSDKDGVKLYAEEQTMFVAFEPTQIKSVENRGTYSPETADIYNKIAYTSGKTFYLSPSTRFVLRGGEGQIVHGWGIYLLENMLENARLYRNKFSSGLLYVENMPEENKVPKIIAYNGLVGENVKKFKEYLSYVLENRPGWTADEGGFVSKQIAVLANITSYLNPLVNEKTTPVTAYFTTLANHRYNDPHNKYTRKQKDGKYKFIIPKNLPLGIKNVLQLTNKKIASAGWYDPYVVLSSNLESWLPDGSVSMFVSDLVGQAKNKPLNKAIKEYTESILRQTNLEPRTTKIPRIAPNLTDEENVQLFGQVYFLGPLFSMIGDNETDAPTRARAFVEILAERMPEFDMDHAILSKNSSYRRTVDGPTEMDISESSPFMQELYEQARKDFNVDFPTFEQINAEFDRVVDNEDQDTIEGLLNNAVLEALFGKELSQEFKNTAQEYLAQLVLYGKDKFRPVDGYKNIDLEQTTATVLDDDHLPVYITSLGGAIRRMYEGKQGSLDQLVTMMPSLYEGYWGLYALVENLSTLDSSEKKLFEDINSGQATFENLDEQESYQKIQTSNEPLQAFIVSVLKRAKEIYKTIKEDYEEEEGTWAAISEAIKTLTDKEKDTLVKKSGMNDKDKELFFKMLANPSGVKKTRGQQLEIEIPNANELLNEEQFLADQASADKIKKFLEDFVSVAGGVVQYLEKGAEYLKDNAYAIKLGIATKYKNVDEWTEDIREQAWKLDDETGEVSDEEKAAIQKRVDDWAEYVMEHMRGENLYRMVMDTLPDMIWHMKDGTELGGDTGEEKDELYDPDQNPTFYVLGNYVTAQNAKETSMILNDYGIKGTTYRGGTDGRGYVIFSDEAINTLRRIDDDKPMYYKRSGPEAIGTYDPEIQTIILGKNWDEVTLVHEFHHNFLNKIWTIYRQAEAGAKTVTPEWMEDTRRLFEMLEIDPNQPKLTTVQQERFAYMVEAYITGLGVENQENLAFQAFLHWVPEKYTSIMSLGYLDENNVIQNPYLDQESIEFFNKWFSCPMVPSLPSAPDAQRMVNPMGEDGKPMPSNQKVMNNREKEWGQDSEKQNKADAQLWQAIGENNPSDMRAALDGQEVINKAETKNLPDDRLLPEKPKLRDKWFKARVPDARERAAEMARAYVEKNPEHARELAFADPETMAEYDAPVDQGMLIRAVMETVAKGSDEWYILDNNLAMVKSMSGSTLALSGDQSHQAYLDAKREVEAARELKAAVNYAGTREGAMDKWNNDIRAFVAKRTAAIMATAPNSEERKVAIQALIEEAKTKFSGNTTNAILNKLDLTGYQTTSQQVFINWAKKQIKEASHARLDTKEQAELMKASIAAQLALRDINSTELKDDQYVRAVAAAKDIRHWQFVKDKMKKAYIGRWGRFGLWADRLFGGYMPSAMLMSANTLFVANIPSTTINTGVVRQAVKIIGENNVDEQIQKDEIKRIRQVFNASGLNLAQMEKPTSPSLMHGEKYTNQEQAHWYNFTFDILGKEDNWFRIPTFVDALARIATRDAKGDKAKANQLFRQYSELGNKDEQAQIGRKLALAVANMAVFTQDGMMASALNHIRSQLNTLSRGILGLEPGGFGLGNLLAPFLKTGANIVEMGLTSTFAPVRTAAMGIRKLQGKQIPDIDKIALATDWINLAITCVAIAVMAAISGDDEDWYEEPYQTGRRYDPDKPYDSIRFGNYWVKLDIFGPIEIPLRTAAMLVKNWEKKKLAAMGDGLYEALEEIPLVNQFVDNQMDYMQKHPEKYWPSFAYNQANKLIPAQVKSLTRAGSRAAGTELDVSKLGKTIERKFHRNYGLDGAQLTTNDLLNILTNRLKYKPQ
jgi:hypothetical protein